MKFEKIKVGDKVLVEIYERVAWNLLESFWILKEVERVSAKQFIVDGLWYKKEDGSGIGNAKHTYAKNIGDKESDWSDNKIKDQTKELNDFRLKQKMINNLNDSISKLSISNNTDLALSELTVITGKIKEIESLINK